MQCLKCLNNWWMKEQRKKPLLYVFKSKSSSTFVMIATLYLLHVNLFSVVIKTRVNIFTTYYIQWTRAFYPSFAFQIVSTIGKTTTWDFVLFYFMLHKVFFRSSSRDKRVLKWNEETIQFLCGVDSYIIGMRCYICCLFLGVFFSYSRK